MEVIDCGNGAERLLHKDPFRLTGYIDHIINAPGDPDIAIRVDARAVARKVVPLRRTSDIYLVSCCSTQDGDMTPRQTALQDQLSAAAAWLVLTCCLGAQVTAAAMHGQEQLDDGAACRVLHHLEGLEVRLLKALMVLVQVCMSTISRCEICCAET